MPNSKRYCFESCAQEQAQAESIGGLKRYWVRSPQGAIDMYFERSEWPKNVEFVRPVQAEESTDNCIQTLYAVLSDFQHEGEPFTTSEVIAKAAVAIRRHFQGVAA
jgi:hypothetical protein